MSMEKLAELKSKFLKFLPRQPVASIQKPNLSPSRSVAGNRSPCQIVSIIPKEARRKLRSSSFSAREPSSPKVSCMGEVDLLMKKKKRKKRKARKNQSTEKAVKKEKTLLWIFKGNGNRRCESSQRKSGKALDLELVENEEAPSLTQNVPSLDTMKKFASGRGTLSDFEVKLAQMSAGSSIHISIFMIYAHAKPKGMIFDDEYVIVGSANMNQRSMAGTKDTEIAMGAYQPHHTWSARQRHPSGQIYGSRMSLWIEHLGLEAIETCFKEPESLECVKKVNEIANGNWSKFTSENFSRLQGHLLKYPVQVDADGNGAPYPDTRISWTLAVEYWGSFPNNSRYPNNVISRIRVY